MNGCGGSLNDPMMQQEVFPPTRAFNALVKFGIIPIVLIFYLTAVLHYDYTPDDTYIYLQYASHLADGGGFSFNQGMPSYGVTGPLWVVVIAVGALGGLDPYIVAKTLDLVFASLSILVLYFVAFGVLRSKVYALAASAIFSFDSWMLRWSGSGMETSLAVLLSLLAIWYVYRNDYLLAAFVCGVLTLVRPEGAILFVIIQIDNLLNSREWIMSRRVLIRSVLLYALVLLPWLITAFVMFGTIVPNTFGAKSIAEHSLASMIFVAGSEVKIVAATQAVPILFLIVGGVMAVRRLPWKIVRLEMFPLFWAVALLVFYIIANVQVVSRYLLLILPEIVVFGLWGMKKMQEFWNLDWRRAGTLLAAAVVLTVGQNEFVYQQVVLPHMTGFTKGMTDGLKPIAYWLREHGTPERSLVTPDVGLMGYISGVRVYDTAGLVTPEMRSAFSGLTYSEGMREERYRSVVQPDFVLDRSALPERLASPHLVPVMTKKFPSIAIAKPGPVYYTLYRGVP